MMSASEIRNVTWLNAEAREAVMEAFNAVSRWRDEIAGANDRYLANVLDQVAAAQRAQGWPNSVTVATREQLLQASKVQTQLIDQLMADWAQQLTARGPSPDPARVRAPSIANPWAELMRLGEITLTPFKIWLNAAEALQRSWAEALRASTDVGPAPPIKRAA